MSTEMTDREIIHAVVNDLALPDGQWFLSGSGAMCLAGIRDHKPVGDIDIFVATRLWFKLAGMAFIGIDPAMSNTTPVIGHTWQIWTTNPDDPESRCDPPYLVRHMHGKEVNVFHSWRIRNVGNIDVNHHMRNTEEHEGVPCISMLFLYEWKLEVGREKDNEDIPVLQEYLSDLVDRKAL